MQSPGKYSQRAAFASAFEVRAVLAVAAALLLLVASIQAGPSRSEPQESVYAYSGTKPRQANATTKTKSRAKATRKASRKHVRSSRRTSRTKRTARRGKPSSAKHAGKRRARAKHSTRSIAKPGAQGIKTPAHGEPIKPANNTAAHIGRLPLPQNDGVKTSNESSGEAEQSYWLASASAGTLFLALFAVLGGVLAKRGIGLDTYRDWRAKRIAVKTAARIEREMLRAEKRTARASAPDQPDLGLQGPADVDEDAHAKSVLRRCLRQEKQFYVLPNKPELAGTLASVILASVAGRLHAPPQPLEGALRTLTDYAIRRSGGAGVDFSLGESRMALQITGSGGLWKDYVERRLPVATLDKLDNAAREFDEFIRDERGNRLLLIRTL